MSNVYPIGLRTPAQARRWLDERGITLTAFAREHGLSRYAVVDVLKGRSKGRYGQAHRAAVALGIKPPPKTSCISPHHHRNFEESA